MIPKLYPHQQMAVDNVNRYLKSHRYALVELAVGLGKSYIISTLALQYKRAVILQPAMELVKQNHEKLDVAGLSSTMIDSAHKGDWSADYIYTTPQTLSKNMDKAIEPEIVLIDEAHMFFNGKMFAEIFSRWHTCKVVMLTATPYYQVTHNEYSEGYMWSVSKTHSIAETLNIAACACIDREYGLLLGYGCPIQFNKIRVPMLKAEHLRDRVTYGSMIESHVRYVKDLIDSMDNCIIYCDSIAQAEMLSERLHIPCVFGKTPKKQRLQIIDDLKSGKTKSLLTVGCLKLGFDFPELKNIILLSNFNNECEAEQVIGRLNRGKGTKFVWYAGRLNHNKPEPGRVTKVKLMALSDLPHRWRK